MKKGIFTLLLALLYLPVLAQKVKTVEGEYVYHAPDNVSPAEAKRYALKQAQFNAMANEFGTIVSQTNLTRLEKNGEQSKTNFISLGSSDVKGEWIQDLEKPEYDISYEDGMLVVECKVKGKARELVSAQADFLAKVLRNGTEDRYESEKFKNGDELFMSFQTPVKGYLAIYLVDDDDRVQCLLPYRDCQDGIYRVEANQRYVLFSIKANPQDHADEYVMEAEHDMEYNQLYVIFSPNQFVKAVDTTSNRMVKSKKISGFPRELSFEDFHKWLDRCRRQDKDMTLKKIILTIEK